MKLSARRRYASRAFLLLATFYFAVAITVAITASLIFFICGITSLILAMTLGYSAATPERLEQPTKHIYEVC